MGTDELQSFLLATLIVTGTRYRSRVYLGLPLKVQNYHVNQLQFYCNTYKKGLS